MRLRCKVGGRKKGRRSEVGIRRIMRLRRKFGIRNSAPSVQIRNSEFGEIVTSARAKPNALHQGKCNLSERGA